MSTVSVRYIVHDVDDALAFYCEHLGFEVQARPAPIFAMLRRGDLRLLLSAPAAPGQPGGGSQPMSDGTRPQPGGWNRFQVEVDALEATVEGLRAAGVPFRSDIIVGVGGDQAIVEDPSGNLVELFRPKS